MVSKAQERVNQFRKECESWRRLLDYLLHENSFLKNRLADIVIQDIDSEMLSEAEDFQNNFIRMDEMIRLLKWDVIAYDSSLTLISSHDTNELEKHSKKQKKIRTEAEALEQGFNKLKFVFNNYIEDKY